MDRSKTGLDYQKERLEKLKSERPIPLRYKVDPKTGKKINPVKQLGKELRSKTKKK